MQIFSQHDPRWNFERIGNSPLTVGRYGCTLTCVAMLTTYFLPEKTPGQLARSLQFTADGLLVWSSCQFENFIFERRVYGRDDLGIRLHLADPNLAVILQVARRTHWVVATSRFSGDGTYQVADPWTGNKATMRRYGDDISGAAFFKKK